MIRIAIILALMMVGGNAWAIECQYLATPITLVNKQTTIAQCDQNGHLIISGVVSGGGGGGGGTSDATAANQVTGNTTLASILSTHATAAKQDTGNTSLSSIVSGQTSTNTKLDTVNIKLDTLHTDNVDDATAANQVTANTTLANILSTHSTSALQTTANTTLASLLTGQTSTNSKLDTVNTKLDTLHTDLSTGGGGGGGGTVDMTATNTALALLHTDLSFAIAPVVPGTSSVNGIVAKGSGGTVYSAYATNLTGTAGFLVGYDSTSVPSDGSLSATLVKDCLPLPANGKAEINNLPGPGTSFTTGVTYFVTSASTCYTKTTGVITAFFSVKVL